MGISTCRLRFARRSIRNDLLRARLTDRDSVQTRQEACVVPRNHPVEQLGVGHSEDTSPEISDLWCANESPRDSSTPVETALPVNTPVSAKCVHQTPSGGLSDAVCQRRRSRKPRPQRGRQAEQGGVVHSLVLSYELPWIQTPKLLFSRKRID